MYYDLTKERRADINKITSELLEKQDEFVATNLESITDDLPELDVYQANFDSKISGYIQKEDDDDEWNIFINENDTLNRQRFTTAHELGHYFLHLQGSTVKEKIDLKEMYRHLMEYSQEEKLQENEADYFASVLLMPEYKVKKAWEAYNNVEDCAKAFQVSQGAMYYRLQELSLVD